ncbi:MAG: maleylpyruvate isomerase family mycothiol-dependent enzyme [Candidatus Tectimicrobiota bacterium]
MTTREERVEILKAEQQRLEQYLHTLLPEAWHHPSTCDQWTVADVIAHLIGGNRRHATWITDALQATSVTPERLPRRSHQRVDAAAMAQRGIALRQELGSHLLSALVTTNRAIAHTFAQVALDDWEKLCYRPNGAEPIHTILDNFIAEVGVHRWDVTYPFDSHVQLAHDCVAVMVERYPHRPRWWDIALPPSHLPLPVRFRFTVSGVTAPGTDFVVATPEEKYMEVAGTVPADVTFRCDAQTFVLLAYGRRSPATALSTGTLTYTGSHAWAELFMRSYIGG